MAKDDYLPLRDGDLDGWLKNFAEKIEAAATGLSIAPADALATKNGVAAQRTAFAAVNTKRKEAKAATETYGKSKKAASDSIRALVRRLKSAPGYTNALGLELGVIGKEITSPSSATTKPVLALSLKAGKVIIAFKKGRTDGIRLYCRRGNETVFSFLGIDMSSPYQDNRPNLAAGQSETREYRAYYFIRDEEIGGVSDTVSIAVS